MEIMIKIILNRITQKMIKMEENINLYLQLVQVNQKMIMNGRELSPHVEGIGLILKKK